MYSDCHAERRGFEFRPYRSNINDLTIKQLSVNIKAIIVSANTINAIKTLIYLGKYRKFEESTVQIQCKQTSLM